MQDLESDHTNICTGPKPPHVVATFPGQENGFFQRQHPLLPESSTTGIAIPSDIIRGGSAAHHPASTSTLPRRFRLCRASAPDLLPQTYVGKKKRRTDQDFDIALLVEATESPTKDFDRAISAHRTGQIQGSMNGDPETRSPLKRPGAGSRVAKTSSPQTNQHNDLDVSLPDQEGLLQYAAEEVGYAYKPQPPTTNSSSVCLVKTTPPDLADWTRKSPHLHLELDDPSKMDTATPESSDDMDYVYDTFVRSQNADDLPAWNDSTGKPSSFGVILIEEDEQTYWQEFGDDETESDKDWNSDQDDENAENYYGADYPEDEVNSDDEHGYGVYRYRHGGASDDEEYGSDWSDGGDAHRFPWKKKPLKSGVDQEGSDGGDDDEDDDMDG